MRRASPTMSTFKTKIELALEMIGRAVRNGDSGHVSCWPTARTATARTFRNTCPQARVRLRRRRAAHARRRASRPADRINAKRESVQELVAALPKKAFRRLPGAMGRARKLCSRFCFVRVKTTHDDGIRARGSRATLARRRVARGREQAHEVCPHDAAARMSKKQIVRILKERWRTERVYEDLKGRARARSLRGPLLPRLASSRLRRPLLLRLRRRRTRPRFSPLGRRDASQPVRSRSRPERHFADSFITARLAIALFLARWLPRCPFCHQPHAPSRCSIRRFSTTLMIELSGSSARAPIMKKSL